MNQNKTDQKQTGYPGSGLTNQTAQEPGFSGNIPETDSSTAVQTDNRRQAMPDKIPWHPGFYGAAELELRANSDALTFIQEYNNARVERSCVPCSHGKA